MNGVMTETVTRQQALQVQSTAEAEILFTRMLYSRRRDRNDIYHVVEQFYIPQTKSMMYVFGLQEAYPDPDFDW